MAQGIYLGLDYRRPKSKKEIKEAVAIGGAVMIEATSLNGGEPNGSVYDIPDGTYYFVGPDPYTSRRFYGQIVKTNGKVVVK